MTNEPKRGRPAAEPTTAIGAASLAHFATTVESVNATNLDVPNGFDCVTNFWLAGIWVYFKCVRSLIHQ
jgi:hypothetical protein